MNGYRCTCWGIIEMQTMERKGAQDGECVREGEVTGGKWSGGSIETNLFDG